MPTNIDELETLGELGHGTCGHVVKMRHSRTNHLMAVKVIDKLLLPVDMSVCEMFE